MDQQPSGLQHFLQPCVAMAPQVHVVYTISPSAGPGEAIPKNMLPAHPRYQLKLGLRQTQSSRSNSETRNSRAHKNLADRKRPLAFIKQNMLHRPTLRTQIPAKQRPCSIRLRIHIHNQTTLPMTVNKSSGQIDSRSGLSNPTLMIKDCNRLARAHFLTRSHDEATVQAYERPEYIKVSKRREILTITVSMGRSRNHYNSRLHIRCVYKSDLALFPLSVKS